MKPRKPVKKVNTDRKKREWTRSYHSEAFVQWIRGQECQGCGGGPCEAAHTGTGGMGRKGDWTTVIALCPTCHRKVHSQGWSVIQLTLRTAEILAAATARRWEDRNATQ